MKNSAWYSKLWHKKLDNLPVKGDAASAWANMQQMLDAHLPVSGMPAASPVAAKSVVAKIVSMAAYVLPAAAMIGTATWFAVKPSAKQKITSKPNTHKEYRLKTDSINRKNNLVTDSMITAERMNADSMGINNTDTVASYADNVKKDDLSVPKNEVAENINKSTPQKTLTAGDALLGKSRTAEKISSKGTPGTSGGNAAHVSNNSTAVNKRMDNGRVSLAYNAAGKKGSSRVSSAYSGRLANGNINSRRNNLTRTNNNGKLSNRGIKAGSNHNEQANVAVSHYNVEIPKVLNSYISPSLNFNDLPAAQNESALFTYKDEAGAMAGNNSLTLADDKPATAANSNVNKPADNKTATAKSPKNKIPKAPGTSAFNFGLEAGLNLSNATGLYGGIAADYALTNRLLIGAGLRFSNGSKVKGSYIHPSFFRPDTAAGFTVNEERKISAIQVPLNLTYKLSNLISLKAGAVINFAGKPGSASYTLGPVGGFRDTLRRATSIDSAVNNSVLTGKVSLGFTGGVSLNFKNFSVDARYLALPPYKVTNPLGNYSSSYNPFQIGVTYWFRQGAKKEVVGK